MIPIAAVVLLFLLPAKLRGLKRSRRRSRLRQQSRPFSAALAKHELYGPGALQEGPLPVDTRVATRPSQIARDIIARGNTLDRIPWLRSGCLPDPDWEGNNR